MPVFLPSPYPDELLYSLLARYANAGEQALQEALWRTGFGRRLPKAEVALPHWLPSLAARLPHSCAVAVTARHLAWRYTLWPYYGHFASEVAVNHAYASLEQDGTWYAAERSFRYYVRVPSRLRICMTCASEDSTAHGEPYWHRSHQLPGVNLCSVHGSVLLETRVSNHGPNRSHFERVPVSDIGRALPQLAKHAEDYVWLARRSARLLNRPLLRNKTNALYGWYGRQLSKYRLLTGGRWEPELTKALQQRFEPAFLVSLGFLPLASANGEWISGLCRRDFPLHPLCHLLVQLLIKRIGEQCDT